MTHSSAHSSLLRSKKAARVQHLVRRCGEVLLFAVASLSVLAVFFIFFYIARDAIPFFQLRGFSEFFLSSRWFPSSTPPAFGALALFAGTAIVTIGAIAVAVPLGVTAAVCLSDILPFTLRQYIKPVIEVLAAIPSVAFGFFALVVLAPLLQNNGPAALALAAAVILTPLALLLAWILGDILAPCCSPPSLLVRHILRWLISGVCAAGGLYGIYLITHFCRSLTIDSGTNALNVSIILGIMALPTVVSVAEDALQAVGRELREGSYALGATRAETLLRVVIPTAASGISAAVILGVMRAVGETMVVWMASGNAAQIPSPFFNFLQPIRTVTATIAGEMGEADHITGSERYHVLFALALCLLLFSFICNFISERAIHRSRKKMGKL